MEDQNILWLFKDNQFDLGMESLIDKYRTTIEKFAFQLGITADKIPDIVQETFIKVSRNIMNYQQQGKLSTWLYKITLNVVRDFYRKEKRNHQLLERLKQNQKTTTTPTYYFENETHVMLHECIQQLSDKYKIVLILFYFHDKSYDEIALILQVSLSTVKTRLHRGRDMLKQMLVDSSRGEVYQNG